MEDIRVCLACSMDDVCLDYMYDFAQSHDTGHLDGFYSYLDFFSISNLRYFIRYCDLDPYREYWYHRKDVIIKSIMVMYSQRIIWFDRGEIVQRVFEYIELM